MSRSSKPNTGRKIRQVKNPDDAMRQAEDMVRRFHGREPREVISIIETDSYDDTLPVYGQLLELNIMTDDGKAYVPIVFARMNGNKPSLALPEMVQVCGDVGGHNLYFKDGDQFLNMEKLAKLGLVDPECLENPKDIITIGPVWSIVYFTDKHHLEGPKYQKTGAAYEHQFGEEADKGEYGEQPTLLYDTRNSRLLLSGGSYTVTENGIKN